MKLINRHESCIGLTLWQWGQTKWELWYCPRGYSIKKHRHTDQDIEIIFLFGCPLFYREVGNEVRTKLLKWPLDIFTVFSIRAGVLHYFNTNSLPMIVLSYEKWKAGIKPTSASLDFKEA